MQEVSITKTTGKGMVMVIFKMSEQFDVHPLALLHSEPPTFYFFYQVYQLGCTSLCVTDQLSKPSSPGYLVVPCCILLSSWAKRKRHRVYEMLQPCCHHPVRAQGLLLSSLLFWSLNMCSQPNSYFVHINIKDFVTSP